MLLTELHAGNPDFPVVLAILAFAMVIVAAHALWRQFTDPASCSVCFGSKRDTSASFGTAVHHVRCIVMDSSSQKLRSLARQSRALSIVVRDQKRAESLQSLARLYDRQAIELEVA